MRVEHYHACVNVTFVWMFCWCGLRTSKCGPSFRTVFIVVKDPLYDRFLTVTQRTLGTILFFDSWTIPFADRWTIAFHSSCFRSLSFCDRWSIALNDCLKRSLCDRIRRYIWMIVKRSFVIIRSYDRSRTVSNCFFHWSLDDCLFNDSFIRSLSNRFQRCFSIVVDSSSWDTPRYDRWTISFDDGWRLGYNEPFLRSFNYVIYQSLNSNCQRSTVMIVKQSLSTIFFTIVWVVFDDR